MKQRKKKDVYTEFIDSETEEYVKSKGVQEQQYAFYLRFLGSWFTPCKHCQEKIDKKMVSTDEFRIGDGRSPIEFKREWVSNDDEWKEVERRKATKEEKESDYIYWI